MGETRKALTYDDRLVIEIGLNRGDKISAIARTLGRNRCTIANEIKRNWTDNPIGMLSVQSRNICIHAYECDKYDVCKKGCLSRCSRCRDWYCNKVCLEFETKACPKHSTAPYCCNNCSNRFGIGCNYPYRFYEARIAHDKATKRKIDSRIGIDCTEEEFQEALKVIEKGLKKGQSPAHIFQVHPELPFGVRSFYNYIAGTKVKNLSKIDLPRAARYKPRSRKESTHQRAIPRYILKNRRYDDFLELDSHLRENVVEMDTVVGRLGKDTQCILTLYFRRLHFQFFLLLEDKSSESVIRALDDIQGLCGGLYKKLFGIILTDRGTEFADAERIENSRNGVPRSKVFYCDPSQSQQKGGCEKNHVELRRILPKRTTNFDKLTKRDMALCMSHVNSYYRKSIDWFAPIELALRVFPPDLIDGLGIEKIEPDEINLTPYLVPHAMTKE